MAPSGGGNNPFKIIIDLVANTGNFITQVKTALNTVTNQVQNSAQKINQSLSNAFGNKATQQAAQQLRVTIDALSSALKNSEKQFQSLKASTADWGAQYLALSQTLKTQTTAWATAVEDLVSRMGNHHRAAQAAIATGKLEIDQAQTALAFLGKRVLTERELAQATDLLRINVERLAKGESILHDKTELNIEAQNRHAAGTKKMADNLGFLANRIKAVVSSLIVANIVYQGVQAFRQMLEESDKLSQSMFNFQASIVATRQVLGDSFKDYSYWEQLVKKLRKELQIFSETDIRNGITATINLTRNLNLSADSIEKIIQIASVLAKTTGVDLQQAISDVTHAMTGSRVVLDKYGLNIRDGDLKLQALKMGLEEATESMSSQEIALVTLNEIYEKSISLIDATGDYQETLAGQIKATDADIADSKEHIASDLGELNLLFKTLYADFLAYIEGVAGRFDFLFKFIERANNLLQTGKKISESVGEAPDPRDYGSKIMPVGGFIPQPFGSESGAKFYQPNQLMGDSWDNKDYIDALQEWQAKVREFMNKNRIPDALSANYDRLQSEYPQPKSPQTAPDVGTGDTEAASKFEDEVSQLIVDRARKRQDAYIKYIQDIDDANTDLARGLREVDEKLGEEIADLNREFAQDLEDAARKYQRALADIDLESNNKLADAEREKNDKVKDLKQKYYDDLRALDRAYFFSLYDAVAANDAIAIKQAERKYNLDKANLDDKLNTEIGQEEEAYQQKIETIRRETADRKRELEQRYREELEDLKIANERKRQEIGIAAAREKADLKQHRDDVLADLKLALQREREEIDRETGRRFKDLSDALEDNEDLYDDHIADLRKKWEKYYDWLLKEEARYRRDSARAGGGTAGTSCEVGFYYDPVTKKCLKESAFLSFQPDPNAPGGAPLTPILPPPPPPGAPGGNQIKVVLGSDGTVSNSFLEAVAGELADVFEQIIIERV